MKRIRGKFKYLIPVTNEKNSNWDLKEIVLKKVKNYKWVIK